MKPADTVAAIATPPGRGGVGIVRVSGGNLLPLAVALTGKPAEKFQPRRAAIADFLAADGQPLDSGLVLYFPAPHSFTGEDVLELQGHGGPVVMQLLLGRCVELGARVAEPGEFARRAFLNDKIDLAQAEGIADLIEAASAQAARSALRSLSGEFSQAVKAVVDQLIELRMLIEATLDFPDEDIPAEELLRDIDAAARLERLTGDLATLRSRARQGALLRTGLHVVLAGLPNVGKSSLLNRLAGEERAIVTDIAGTTRDALRETIQVEGIPLHVIDTAGLRDTEDAVEKIGIERTWREIERADVVLQIVDARAGVTPADHAITVKLPAGIERIVIENKSDIAGSEPGRHETEGQVHLCLSAKTGAGMHLLHDELLRVAGWVGHGEDVLLARERHLEALRLAAERLAQAGQYMPSPAAPTFVKAHVSEANVMPEQKSALAARRLEEPNARLELVAEELRLAQQVLSAITGEFSADDLLGEIFGRFCIGK